MSAKPMDEKEVEELRSNGGIVLIDRLIATIDDLRQDRDMATSTMKEQDKLIQQMSDKITLLEVEKSMAEANRGESRPAKDVFEELDADWVSSNQGTCPQCGKASGLCGCTFETI